MFRQNRHFKSLLKLCKHASAEGVGIRMFTLTQCSRPVLPGVLGAEFEQRKLVATLRNGEGHAGDVHIRKEGNYNLFAEVLELALDFGDEGAQHRSLRFLDPGLEAQIQALHHRPAADSHKVPPGFKAIAHQREHVGVDVAGGGDDASGIVLLQPLHAFLPVLRVLETQFVSRLLHKAFVFPDKFAGAAFQQGGDFSNPAAVLVGTHLSGAAAGALPYLEIQTGPYLPAKHGIGVYLVTAGAQRPDLVNRVQKGTGMHHGAVRAEILGSVAHNPAGEEHAREWLGSDADPGIGLAVLKEYVVVGLVLLDEVVLQQQGVGLGVHHAVLHVGDLAHQDTGLGIEPFGRHEILGHPLAEVLCLAYINNRSLGVVIPVNSGGMRQQFYFILNLQESLRLRDPCSLREGPLHASLYARRGRRG